MKIQRILSGVIAGIYGLGFVWVNVIPSDGYTSGAGALFSFYSVSAIILFFMSVFTSWLFNSVNTSEFKKTIAYTLCVIIMLPIIYTAFNLIKLLL